MGQNRSSNTYKIITLKVLLKVLFSIIFISAVLYYSIDTIQYKYNLMDIEDYDPISTLKVEENIIKKSKIHYKIFQRLTLVIW